ILSCRSCRKALASCSCSKPKAAAESRPPSGCRSVERGGHGSYPFGCDRAVSVVSLRGFLRRLAASRRVATRLGVPLKSEITPRQEGNGDVMQQCGEPYTLALSRRSAHGVKAARRSIPAQCPGRGRLVAVPLGRGPSLHGLRRGRALFVRLLHRYHSL